MASQETQVTPWNRLLLGTVGQTRWELRHGQANARTFTTTMLQLLYALQRRRFCYALTLFYAAAYWGYAPFPLAIVL
jgi:phage gp16-like protein